MENMQPVAYSPDISWDMRFVLVHHLPRLVAGEGGEKLRQRDRH